MSKKRILMPMLEAGAGHKMPAIAVKDAINELYPDQYEIEVVDLGQVSGALKADKTMKDFWDYNLAHKGFAVFMYNLMEFTHPLSHCVLPLGFREYIKKGSEFIRDFNPDVIFSTHYYNITVSCMARDKFKLPINVIGFITDPFGAYSFWCEKRADIICVASEEAKIRAMKHGIKEEKIRIFDFPINKKFFILDHNKEELRKQYNVDPDMRTILFTAGGQGIGNMGDYIRRMAREEMPFNIIAVCGRNEALKKELEDFKATNATKTNIIPLGFVSNMNELLSISDACVAKAGASTTLEALHMDAPVIFIAWANQAEKYNIDFCLDHNVGWDTPNEKNFFDILHQIMDSDILEQYQANITKLNLKTGVDDIARFVVSQIKS